MKILTLVFCCFVSTIAFAQQNIISTNPLTLGIMQGNYDPAQYQAQVVIDDHLQIIQGIQDNISPDSLHAYLEALVAFENRNTCSDTVSSTRGIGAARRWAFQKFQQFSADNDSRLVTSYLQFERMIDTVLQHRNIFTVLPGRDTSNKEVIIIEGHIDSRCEGRFDGDCAAPGAEDNGSGTALVLELARVMSKYTFDQTIVFLLTIGEEQGLYGAEAFAKYCVQENIPVEGVLNNDVIGGVICGKTSSAPGCPGEGDIDSMNVRLFSYGTFNSKWKGLARWVKLEYEEELNPIAPVKMNIQIMTGEDRAGRGGDHIPFRLEDISSVRFTAANEHGDAGVGPGYHDRQHTTTDELGVDTNGDGILDSFFVHFRYLARNAAINGMSAALLTFNPATPSITTDHDSGWVEVSINSPFSYSDYRIGIRTQNHDFDTLINTGGQTEFTVRLPNGVHFISAAAVNNDGIESLFSNEKLVPVQNSIVGGEFAPTDLSDRPMELLQNRPNPFDHATTIGVYVQQQIDYREAWITITDMEGRQVKRIPVTLSPGLNEVNYEHGYGAVGTFIYALVVDGKKLYSKRMVFAN